MSTYPQAAGCFEENAELMGVPVIGVTPKDEMILWNLNAGLLNLVLAIQSDQDEFGGTLEVIQARLARIEQALMQR